MRSDSDSIAVLILAALVASACSSEAPSSDLLSGIQIVGDDPTDIPLTGADADLRSRFRVGDAKFDAVFREVDGLGPLYIRSSCASCHDAAGRGPGVVQKMALCGPDDVCPLDDQSGLAYGHTIRPYVAAGAKTPIGTPDGMSSVKLTKRAAPSVFGRGYMEAVADSEIERIEAEQAARSDGISGRINRVVFHSAENVGQDVHTYKLGDKGLIGRFGLKARVATLDDFTADAFQGDMGITSPLRPEELPNPDDLSDDAKAGIDIDLESVNAVADYLRLLEIPRRTAGAGDARAIFGATKCDVCHVPALLTRTDYPIALLAGVDAPVFTDFLLHDMGDGLADALIDEGASSREWRTAPLVGLRHIKTFMHDGRAPTLEQAILLHEGEGSEANESVALFRALSIEERGALLTFLGSL